MELDSYGMLFPRYLPFLSIYDLRDLIPFETGNERT